MNGAKRIVEFLRDYTSDFSINGIVRLVVDVLCVLLMVGLVIFYLKKYKRVKTIKILILMAICVLGIAICIIFDLLLTKYMMYLFGVSLVILICVAYAQDFRHALEEKNGPSKSIKDGSTDEEKMQVINIICKCAEDFSRKRIGALMVIERNDSLDEWIDKAIRIEGIVSQELLGTIFWVGTPCHDGAVIIRGNKVMCAASILPSTDKTDLQKDLGTRHRAAIGISDKYDCLTVVVSEQSGGISVTLEGGFYQNIGPVKLREMLESNLLEQPVKSNE